MIAGLLDVLDPSAHPAAVHVAQIVLAGTVATHVGVLRPASARADLLLEAEMVHGDLTGYLRSGQLPAGHPQVQDLERTLAALRRLPRRSAARALVRGGPGSSRPPGGTDRPGAAGTAGQWWSGDSQDDASAAPISQTIAELLPAQQARLNSCLHRLDDATQRYLRVVRPWRWLPPGVLPVAPRHATGDAAGPTADPADHPIGPLSPPDHPSDHPCDHRGHPVARPRTPSSLPQRHVRGATRAMVKAAIRPDEPASVPLSAGDIAAAISRSQGRPGAISESPVRAVELGSTSLSETLHHH